VNTILTFYKSNQSIFTLRFRSTSIHILVKKIFTEIMYMY